MENSKSRIFAYEIKVNYSIMLILDLFQLGTIIWFSCVLSFFSIYIHLTNWSFLLSSIYLFLAIICDTTKIIFSSTASITFSFFTSQNNAIFSFCESVSETSLLKIIISG